MFIFLFQNHFRTSFPLFAEKERTSREIYYFLVIRDRSKTAAIGNYKLQIKKSSVMLDNSGDSPSASSGQTAGKILRNKRR